MKILRFCLALFFCMGIIFSVYGHNTWTPKVYIAPLTANIPTIDGNLTEQEWGSAAWDSTNYLWQPVPNDPFDKQDFFARFKILWCPTNNRLYVAVKIQDDVYLPGETCPDEPQDQECVEVFLDPDHSGGVYAGTGNAFSYHIITNGDAFNPLFVPYNSSNLIGTNLRNHIRLGLSGDSLIWEMEFKLYSKYQIDHDSVEKIMAPGDTIGFSIAYNDEDDNDCERDNMVGWVEVHDDDSWQNSNRFGNLALSPDTAKTSILPSFRFTPAEPLLIKSSADVYTIFGQKIGNKNDKNIGSRLILQRKGMILLIKKL